VPARVVMEILGHSQIALTMNTYSHVAAGVSREAADRIARMLCKSLRMKKRSRGQRRMSALAARVAAWLACWLAGETAIRTLTSEFMSGAPGARTLNPRIKSPLLYH